MCALVQTVVLSWLFLKIAVAINLTCDTVSPAVQSDVTCVCKRTSGTSIDWLFDDTLNSNCELFFNCIPKKTGYNYFINSTENFYEITIMSYSYSDCTKVTCKDASDGNIKQSVVPSSITFDSTYPTSLSEPSASHINGTISVTTGCISGYSGVKYVWYTISDEPEEMYTPDQKSIIDTTDTSTCLNCSVNNINGKRTIGFEHTEASGDNTKNVHFRVVLSHESTNSIINLTSSQSYTVKVKSVVAPGDSWCSLGRIWICHLIIVFSILFLPICYGVAHLIWICWNWTKCGVCCRKKEKEQWPHWTLCGYCCCCDPEKVCCRCIGVSCKRNKVKPATPSCLKVVKNEVTEKKINVKVQWNAGWNGGCEQRFYLTCTGYDKPFVTEGVEYLLKDLKERTEYKITLHAENEVGKSKPTEAVLFTTIGKPDTPTAFWVLENEVTENSIKVQWDPGFNGGCEQTFYLSCIKKYETKDVTYELNGLQEGKQYNMILKAGNDVGKSKAKRLSWRTIESPKDFRGDAHFVTKNSIKVKWKKGCNDKYSQTFELSCSDTPDTLDREAQYTEDTDNEMQMEWNNLSTATYYYIQLRAKLTEELYTKWQEIKVRTLGQPDKPSVFKCSLVKKQNITVQWVKGYDGGYDQDFVLECTNPNTEEVKTATINASKVGKMMTHTFMNLTENTLYTLTISSWNLSGHSETETIHDIKTLCDPGPPVAFNYKKVTEKSIQVHWTPGSNGGTKQKFTLTCSGNPDVEIEEEKGIFEHTFTNLTSGKKYTLSIQASNSEGKSHLKKLDVRTLGPPDKPPEFDVVVKERQKTSIKVKWKPGYNGGFTQQFILSCLQNHKEVNEPEIVPDEKNNYVDGHLEHTFNNLKEYTTYVLKIAAQNEKGKSEECCLDAKTKGFPQKS